MTFRIVTTESSIWTFDLSNKLYKRVRREDPVLDHWNVDYTGEWEPFEKIEDLGTILVVHRPVPWGTGARRKTGVIVSDEIVNVM